MDAGTDGGQVSPAIRQIAPLSTATVTSQTPRFHWELAGGLDGAQVEVCRDRACTSVVTTLTASGTSAQPSSALSAGVYYWRVYGSRAGTVVTPVSPVWEFWVGHRSAPVNTSWGQTLDVNGDGYADVIVGAPAAGPGYAYVYLGSASGLPTQPSMTLAGATPNGYFGHAIASVGDVNGDGFGDVAAITSDGSAAVFLGAPGGPAASPSISLPSPVKFSGSTVAAGAGDVNGDGYADVLVGGPMAGGGVGALYVYFGGPNGPATTPAVTIDGPSEDLADGGGRNYANTNFAWSIAAADVNGDGFGDVLLSVGSEGTGRVLLYLGTGTPSGLGATATTVLSPTVSTWFGASVGCAGDVNGDGLADVVVGASDVPDLSGSAYLYLGTTSGTGLVGSSTSALFGSDPADGGDLEGYFGGSVSGVGDLNGDGFADIAVGSGYTDGPSAFLPNSVYVYGGSASGLTSTPTILTPKFVTDFGNTLAGFTFAVAPPGDLNGDGFADLVLGAMEFDGINMGFAYVYPGSDVGVTTLGPTLDAPDAGGDAGFGEFGSTVAIGRLPR